MTLTHYTPHILSAASLFLSIYIHWRMQQYYWRPSLISGLCSAIVALLLIFVLQDNYLNLNSNQMSVFGWGVAVMCVAGLAFCYGFIIALLTGYVIKFAPSFFD